MSEENESFHITEEGYHVCPVCRFTFKCRAGSRYVGVVCPSCSYLLKARGASSTISGSFSKLSAEYAERRIPEWEKEDVEYTVSRTAKIVGISIVLSMVVVASLLAWKIYTKPVGAEVVNQPQTKLATGGGQSQKNVQSAKLRLISFFTAKSTIEAKNFVYVPAGSWDEFEGSFKEQPWLTNHPKIEEGVQIKGSDIVRFQYRVNGKSDQCHMRLQGGEWFVDWASLVGANNPSVDAFIKQSTGEKRSFYCRVEASNYYDFTHTSAKWLSLKLTFSDSDRVVYGYIDRSNSMLLAKFENFDTAHRHGEVVKMILDLRKFEDSTVENQFYIEAVKSSSWFTQ